MNQTTAFLPLGPKSRVQGVGGPPENSCKNLCGCTGYMSEDGHRTQPVHEPPLTLPPLLHLTGHTLDFDTSLGDWPVCVQLQMDPQSESPSRSCPFLC